MKRRNFIKGILGLSAVPVVVKAGNFVGLNPDIEKPVYDICRDTYGNKMLTPEEVTREALKVLEYNMNKSSFKGIT